MINFRTLFSRLDRTISPRSEGEPARTIDVVVDGRYQPGSVGVMEGEPVRLRFLRRDRSACTREVVFPTLGIRKELPTGREVLIDLPALPSGEHPFTCGMNMVRGAVVVNERA